MKSVVVLLSLSLSAAAQGFGPEQVITNAASDARSVYATDIDGDGDADVLSASYTDFKVAWYENVGAGNGVSGDRGHHRALTAACETSATDLLRRLRRIRDRRDRIVLRRIVLDALVDDLRDLSGDSREGPAEPFDTTALFALLAIPLLLWESVVDARRGVSRDPRGLGGVRSRAR